MRPYRQGSKTLDTARAMAVSACTSLAGVGLAEQPGPAAGLAMTPIASGFASPVSLQAAPGEPDRLYVVERIGRVRVLERSDSPSGYTVLPDVFLDIASQVSVGGERGMLDLAFDPDYESNRHVYVSYNETGSGDMLVARFTASPDGSSVDPATETTLLAIRDYFGHNGGQLRFGPDGMLYFSAGDGTLALDADPDNNAQRLDSPHGKIHRLDTDNPPTYVPADNPFVGVPGAIGTIAHTGLRNPWRFTFDRATGDMYIGDVGRDAFEEINIHAAGTPLGLNYGWRCREGTICTGLSGCTCPGAALTDPALPIPHDTGDQTCSVIAGFVYRGSALPSLTGRVLYTDFCGEYIRSGAPDFSGAVPAIGDVIDHTADFDPLAELNRPVGFGEDLDGEVFIVAISGTVWKLVPLSEVDCNANGILDRTEIASGNADDCNGNGLPDSCEIAAGGANDCNANGIPDACEFGEVVSRTAPPQGPLNENTPLDYTFNAPPAAFSPVAITVDASGQLNSVVQWLDVFLNGRFVGTLFQSAGQNCPAQPQTGTLTIEPGTFNEYVAGGDATVTVVPSRRVRASACPDSSATVTLGYLGPDPETALVDLAPPVGVLNIDDVLVFLDAFATGDTALADLAPPGDPDGDLNIDDVLRFLSVYSTACE